jgi:hypothetical protein
MTHTVKVRVFGEGT